MGFLDRLTAANKPAFDAVTGAAASARDVSQRANDPTQMTIPSNAEYIYSIKGPSDLLTGRPDYLSWTDGAGNPIGAPSGSGAVATAPVSDQYDYYNAKLASKYKMSAETAYQEALSNTAYQRAVEDLKAAGLNPVLAAGKVSGADSFYGQLDSGASGGSGGGFSGGRSYSGKSSGKGLMRSAINDYNFRKGLAAVAGQITYGATHSFPASAAAYYFSQSILGAVAKIF